MQSSYWGYWLVVMGVAIVGLMISVNGLTTTSTQDYYGVKEIVEASMLESVDYGYYRDYNEVKMNKEKFMEVFVRMIAESMSSTDTYEVNFYEIYEAPPKVSVEVRSNSGTSFISNGEYDVTTRVDAVIQVHAEQSGDSGNTKPNQPTNPTNPGDDNPTESETESVKITNKEETKGLSINNKVTLNIIKTPANATCTWSSDNTGMATVTNGGVVTIKEEGVVNITVTCGTAKDSVEIIVDHSTGACKAWLEDFKTNASGSLKPGETYEATATFIIQPPESKVGSCDLRGKSGIQISEPIGLNENTNIFNSTFEGERNLSIDFDRNNQEAKFDVSMKFKVPENYTSGRTIKLNAYIAGSNEKEISLTVGSAIADACKTGISESWEGRSIEGVSLTNVGSGARGKIYATLNDIQNGTGDTRNALPNGTKFKILGETGNYWAIEYEGKCGWVDNRYMGISLTQYLPSSSNPIDYNVTNASSSIFKTQGNNISGITGRQLYKSEYSGFVPLNYQYAKTLKNSILPKARSMGYRLVIVDAFRPDSVSKAVYNATKPYAAKGSAGDKCSSGLNCYKGKIMGLSWFIALTSTHGTGCALDVTLKQNGNTIWNAYQDGVANIHELSTSVLKYSNTGCYRKHSCTRNYVAKYNESKYAQDLNAIMMSDNVITDLPSEWWHFNHETCINTMGKDNTVDFWSMFRKEG